METQISNHPRLTVDGQPVKRYTKYLKLEHDLLYKVINVTVLRIHRIVVDGLDVSIPNICPDNPIVLQITDKKYVDSTGTRVTVTDPENLPAGVKSEYDYWYDAFTQPQQLWQTIEDNIADQVSKGVFDQYPN
jgi:hypothetical protein